MATQGAERISGASVAVEGRTEARRPRPVGGRLAVGYRRRAGGSGVAQGTGRTIAEPPAWAHGKTARLSAVGEGSPDGPAYAPMSPPTGWAAIPATDGATSVMGSPIGCASMLLSTAWPLPSGGLSMAALEVPRTGEPAAP